jgi:hypothetical protein
LRAPRIAPTAFLLDDGRLFVGGGLAADGTPLSALEWLSGDARSHLQALFPPELPARYDRAFAALPGGGVLAVGGCEQREADDADDAELCREMCRKGCPPRGGYDAWWITPDYELFEVELEASAPRPVLLGGGDGRPLFSGGAPSDTRVYRFDPWRARFDALSTQVPSPPRAGLPAQAIDVQAFVWLAETDDGVLLSGIRLGTRNRYARDVALVAQPDPEFPGRPLNLVPDRPLDSDVVYDGSLSFARGAEPTVYVAATDYADVSISIRFEGAPPRVRLGEDDLGGDACPWPAAASSLVEVIRRGQSAELVAGDELVRCKVAAGRLRVGLRVASDDETRISSLDVLRR